MSAADLQPGDPALTLRPVPGLTIVPVRHHSPACAAALSTLIARERPTRILIEMPEDFQHLLPLLLDPLTRPPVAVVALARRKGDPPGPDDETDPDAAVEVAGSFPFSAHAPEWIAIREGAKAGARIRFIDRASSARLAEEDPDDAPPAATPPTALPLADDRALTGGDYIAALCERVGARDGFELWDQMFEARLADDADALLTDVLTYCAALRAATPEHDRETLEREAVMVRHLRAALAEDDGGTIAVVGGFHAPALIAAALDDAPAERTTEPAPARAWLTRFGHVELDAHNAYAAGLPLPGYYDAVWNSRDADGRPDWRGVARDALVSFRRAVPDPPSLPATVEALRVAENLASLRGRPGPMRTDVLDAARSAFVKNESGRGVAGRTDPLLHALERHLAGTAIGDVPPSAGSPPLLEAVREEARRWRFDVEDGTSRSRTLDIRRKPRHARVSRFLRQLALLDVGFARLVSGPDFATGHGTHLMNETWDYAWSHRVEATLIERATFGSTPAGAATGLLWRRFAELAQGSSARDSGAAATLLAQGVAAGLGPRLVPLARRVGEVIDAEPRFANAVHALNRLGSLRRSWDALRSREGGANAGSTTGIDIEALARAAYRRVHYLLPGLLLVKDDETGPALDSLRDALRGTREYESDDAPFREAVARLGRDADAMAGANRGVAGAALAVAARDSGDAAPLAAAVRGRLAAVTLDDRDRAALLRGALAAEPSVTNMNGIMEAIDASLTAFDENTFMDALPDLRLAFTALNPRETDRVAARIAELHGTDAGAVRTTTRATLGTVSEGSRIDVAIANALETDGLSAWGSV